METRSLISTLLVAGLWGGSMTGTAQETKHKNRLSKEKSPYLLQHAGNPVDWYPWGEEAFKKAKDENKPIFLSIGYSTCHWCHVMERESFESEAVAAVLNANFVSIKVDREERPEVDAIYMNALTQVMGRHGGWPMSMFLTPDRKPFFGGTYFPPEDRGGMPSFTKVLDSIRTAWTERGDKVLEGAESISENLKNLSALEGKGAVDAALVTGALGGFESRFDDVNGGFGGAPKFPQASFGLFLLRQHKRTKSERALAMVESQLEHMAAGGIYDHLAGGFARYSTDEKWLVPHFEKMLYDNAQLLKLYAEAHQVTGKELYARVARETADYVLREMTEPQGGFASAEDADSEDEEGKFYVWRKAEVDALLGAPLGRVFGLAYDVTAEGNWEGDPHVGHQPLNVLNAKLTVAQVAKLEKLESARVTEMLAEGRRKLLEARSKRVRPLRDDKVLAAWNGLMISGLAAAARALNEPRYAAAATKAAEFARTALWKDGTLLRSWRQGEASALAGTLADYAYLTQGLLDLYEATLEPRWLAWASELNDKTVEHFYDAAGGGFFMAREGQADLIVRPKEWDDGAVPAGNSVAILNLVRLAEIRQDEGLRKKAEASAGAIAELMRRHPVALPYLLIAVDHLTGPSRQIVIAGDPASPLVRAVQERFLTRTVVVRADLDPKLVPMVAGKGPVDGKAAVYVCENYTCKLPVTDPAELKKLLR